ncbi:MAG: hypothetical protein V4717_20280 [Bacteroidota bacterium]
MLFKCRVFTKAWLLHIFISYILTENAFSILQVDYTAWGFAQVMVASTPQSTATVLRSTADQHDPAAATIMIVKKFQPRGCAHLVFGLIKG